MNSRNTTTLAVTSDVGKALALKTNIDIRPQIAKCTSGVEFLSIILSRLSEIIQHISKSQAQQNFEREVYWP